MTEVLVKFTECAEVFEGLIDGRELLKGLSNSLNQEHTKETKMEILKAISNMIKIPGISKELLNILLASPDGKFLVNFFKLLLENDVSKV